MTEREPSGGDSDPSGDTDGENAHSGAFWGLLRSETELALAERNALGTFQIRSFEPPCEALNPKVEFRATW